MGSSPLGGAHGLTASVSAVTVLTSITCSAVILASQIRGEYAKMKAQHAELQKNIKALEGIQGWRTEVVQLEKVRLQREPAGFADREACWQASACCCGDDASLHCQLPAGSCCSLPSAQIHIHPHSSIQRAGAQLGGGGGAGAGGCQAGGGAGAAAAPGAGSS